MKRNFKHENISLLFFQTKSLKIKSYEAGAQGSYSFTKLLTL